MAATYHDLHPEASILILDGNPCIGGTWASHRIFPGLKTNNLLGMFEHPDFPMDEARFAVKKGEHIPAGKMLEYLQAFVEQSGISGFIRLKTSVQVVEKVEDGWKLQCLSSSDGKTSSLTTPKLVIAVGNTNKPKMPRYEASPAFESPILHSRDFPAQFQAIVKPDAHTLVVGGGKSALDVAYACAQQANATVTMLIRPSGIGPHWVSPSHVTPFGLWLEKLVFTRLVDLMSPCPWAPKNGAEGWFRSFLHGTWIGRKVVGAFWKILGDDVIALNKLHDHPETEKMVPWRGGFEASNCLSIHNYPTNFFDLVRDGRVKIEVDEIQSLEAGREVVLKSGEKLKVDAIVCATGWEVGSTLQFKPAGLGKELGMPSTAPLSPSESTFIQSTESSLLNTYPTLARDTRRINHPDPSLRHTPSLNTTQQPYRLHRFIVPPSHLHAKSIAFAGALYCLGTFPCAYIQSLWICAYFDSKLSAPFPAPEEVEETMYRDTQYCVLRAAGGYGRVAPDMVFDSLSYFDRLCRDLGVERRRKGGAWRLREWVGGYGPQEYLGLVREWVKNGEKGEEGKKVV
ncbi:flavin-binding monooxygenase-like protein-like protein [Phaeosphaeria sp. MPI-PUGE-AT-0046c]|nr:flavin-binding monooxygenase-like protein-like protein [Phaeosphaeria sp. MPI-PUGE-AT-0046c]